MINPYNIKHIEQNNENYKLIKIDNVPDFDQMEYELTDEKEFKKYIMDVKKNMRGSFEYRQLVNYLREYMEMNKCSFFENVNNIDSFKIQIHLHHHPLCLEDICIVVFNKRNFFQESVEIEAVALEAMYLHYTMLIGLIPLSETPHELVHNKFLFIPSDKVYGHYDRFIDMYKDFMLPEQLDTLEKIDQYTKEYNEALANQTVLERNYIYLDTEFGLPSLEKLEDIIDNKIKDIKENKCRPLIEAITFVFD